MGEWPTLTTAELIAAGVLQIGDGYRAKNSELGVPGLPFIRAGDVHGRVNTIGTDILRSESVLKAGTKISKPGDVVITTKGTVGRVALVREGDPVFVYSPQLCYWRSTNQQRIDPNWLFYWVRSDEFAHQMRWSAGQTDMAPYMSLTDQRTFFKITVPPIPEQRAIAGVLSALDDKIELNRKMNATLEAMARALFRDWFVDFGPTRARMQGRPPYLAPEIWSLFPDRLDDEGKPEGWASFTLNDLAAHHRASLSPSEQPNRVFEHYSIPAHDAGNQPSLDVGATIRSNKTIVPDGAVLLSKLNPEIERVWLPNPKGEFPQVTSTEFLVFTPTGAATRALLYSLFKSDAFRAKLTSMVTGTSKSHQRVSPKALIQSHVLAAAPDVIAAFDRLTLPLLERILANRHESRTLAQTRDLLLPRLMSGELRVAEAEKIVEEAL